MSAVEEMFRAHARHLRGVEPAAPGSIAELEKLIGRALPSELAAYHRLAGGNPGNLAFVQTHKTIRPTVSDALAAHRPRRHGSRKKQEKPVSKIFFGDGDGCQDCGAAYVLLAAPDELRGLEIDPEDPPVGGYDYDELRLLAPRFSEYVRGALPRSSR